MWLILICHFEQSREISFVMSEIIPKKMRFLSAKGGSAFGGDAIPYSKLLYSSISIFIRDTA